MEKNLCCHEFRW